MDDKSSYSCHHILRPSLKHQDSVSEVPPGSVLMFPMFFPHFLFLQNCAGASNPELQPTLAAL